MFADWGSSFTVTINQGSTQCNEIVHSAPPEQAVTTCQCFQHWQLWTIEQYVIGTLKIFVTSTDFETIHLDSLSVIGLTEFWSVDQTCVVVLVVGVNLSPGLVHHRPMGPTMDVKDSYFIYFHFLYPLALFTFLPMPYSGRTGCLLTSKKCGWFCLSPTTADCCDGRGWQPEIRSLKLNENRLTILIFRSSGFVIPLSNLVRGHFKRKSWFLDCWTLQCWWEHSAPLCEGRLFF